MGVGAVLAPARMEARLGVAGMVEEVGGPLTGEREAGRMGHWRNRWTGVLGEARRQVTAIAAEREAGQFGWWWEAYCLWTAV